MVTELQGEDADWCQPGPSLTLGEGGEYSHTLGTSTTLQHAKKEAGAAWGWN